MVTMKTAAWDPLPQEREIARQLVVEASREYLRSKRQLRVFRRSGRPNGRQHIIARYFREVREIVDPWLGTTWVPDPTVELIDKRRLADSGSSHEQTGVGRGNIYIVDGTYPRGCVRIADEERTRIVSAIAHEYCHHIQQETVQSYNRRNAIIRQSFDEEVVSLRESRKSIARTDLAEQLRNMNTERGIAEEMIREVRLRRRALDTFEFLSEGHARGVEMYVARQCARDEHDGWHVWSASWNVIPDVWRAYAALSVANGVRPSVELLRGSFPWLAQEIPDAQTALSQYSYGTYQLRRLAMERGDAIYRELPHVLFGPDEAGRRQFLAQMRLDFDANTAICTKYVL